MKYFQSFITSVSLVIGSLLFSLILVEGLYRGYSSFRAEPISWSDRPTEYFNPETAKSMQGNIHPPRKSKKKSEGVFRIAVLGDSFSFAPHMQYDDAFPARLERLFSNADSKNKTIEVINYGVPGYSTSHEAQEAKRAITEGADLLILQITLNDPQKKSYQPTGLTGLNQFGAFQPTPSQEALTKYWKSYGYLLERLHNTDTHKRYVDYYYDLFENETTWNHFSSALERLRKISKRRETPVIAVVFPLFGLPLDESYPFTPLHEKVNTKLKELDIPSLDLYSLYQGIPLSRLQVIPGADFHPNEIGHRMAAEVIYKWLETFDYLPAESFAAPTYQQRTDIRLLASNLVESK